MDGSVQDCSNSSALAMELLQSCTRPWLWSYDHHIFIMGISITEMMVFILKQALGWLWWGFFTTGLEIYDHVNTENDSVVVGKLKHLGLMKT